MTGTGHPVGCEAHAGDAAAYALGALEPAEAAEFERHLRTCAGCREELSAFEQVVSALPESVPQYDAPRALRRRLLQDYRSERRTSSAHGLAGAQGGARARRRFWSLQHRPSARTLAGGAVAALALAAVIVVIAVSGGGPATRTITARVIGSHGSAELRLSGSRAELVVEHFPAPAAFHVYETWLLHGHRTIPSTLFSVGTHGEAAVEVAGDLHSASAVLVTQEPAGGTLVPTTAPVIVAPLPS